MASRTAAATAAFCPWWLPSSPTRTSRSHPSGVRRSTMIPSQPASVTSACQACPGPARWSGAWTALGPGNHRRQPPARRPGHRQVTPLDDGRLLPTDGGQGPPQVPLVVVLDGGHDRDAQVSGIRGIEAPTEPDLDHRGVDLGIGQRDEAGGGQDLELGGRPGIGLDSVHRVQDRLNNRRKRRLTEQVAVHRDPFAIRDEVRLGHGSHPVAGGAEHRCGEGHHAALPVGAGHQRPAQGSLGVIELGQDPLDALQAQAHPKSASAPNGRDRRSVGERRGQPCSSSKKTQSRYWPVRHRSVT